MITYLDVEMSPSEPGDLDMYLLKISNSGLVTVRTRYGLATARAGEYFKTSSGVELGKLKSVDIKTGKVIYEVAIIACN